MRAQPRRRPLTAVTTPAALVLAAQTRPLAVLLATASGPTTVAGRFTTARTHGRHAARRHLRAKRDTLKPSKPMHRSRWLGRPLNNVLPSSLRGCLRSANISMTCWSGFARPATSKPPEPRSRTPTVTPLPKSPKPSAVPPLPSAPRGPPTSEQRRHTRSARKPTRSPRRRSHRG